MTHPIHVERVWRKAARLIALAGAAGAVTCGALAYPSIAFAAPQQLTGLTVKAASASGHEAALAVDGRADTYWQSPDKNSMQDYRRFIDVTFDGTYRISSISLQNVPGSYYHYEVYLSQDGSTYNKVAYKANNNPATANADQLDIEPTEACAARISVSFNSGSQQVNIAEVSFLGEKVSNAVAKKPAIEVQDFAASTWGKEWNRFETDKAYANKKVVNEASNLVERVLGAEWRDKFVFELRDQLDGKDVFEIADAGDGRIKVRGNDGISLASGLNYYLRNFCKVDYNPLFGSQLDMPATLPSVGEGILKFTDYEYRYALNFCTYSYTMAFWNWDEYEPFLDWCAMNGVNLVLDIVGQEEVLRQTLLQYNYTNEEVQEYLSGPAYFAWFYMQNLYSVGGPLPESWFAERVELARQIHDRMQTYGIDPVIQGFGGQVPADFQQKNPKSVAASSGSWSGFARPHMIKTYLTDEDRNAGKEDYFQKVGTTFYEAQERIFGKVSHFYAVDPFHEGGTVPQGFNIVDIYRTVQQKMLDYDPQAVWVMQQWQWGIDDNKLSGLAKKEQALVLDLQSDLRSQAGPMENQHVPWVWNMLHNFGGRMGMDGVPEVLATKIPQAYNSNKYMRGIGITPEAIDNSPIVYELLFDMTWEQDPVDYRAWMRSYVERRYGGTDAKIQEAWDILLDTAYKHVDGEYYQGASESIMNARPSDNKINAASTWGHSDIDYDKKEFERAAQLFIESYDTYKDSEAFRYDFVDVMRQMLANAFQEYQPLAGDAYKQRNAERFELLANQMLKMLDAQDRMLSTSSDFMLGTWIENARTLLTDADDWTADLFELNARSLITTWGLEKNGSLIDYSNRQWSGLTGSYYKPRWEAWANARKKALKDGGSAQDLNWFTFGWEWANRKSDQDKDGFATKPAAEDPKALAQEIMKSYSVTAMDGIVGDAQAEELQNLARGKVVTDVATQQKVDNLTDGNTDSGWTTPGKQEATLEIDLGGTYAVKGAGITLQQIAADFPLRYEITALVGDEWVKVGESTADTVSSKNEITCDVLASKMRFKVSSTDGQNLTGIYELSVMGAATPSVSYKNLSRGAKASAKSTEGSRKLEWGIDGDEKTLWVGNGSEPNWYQVDLSQPQRVDRVRLLFEDAGRQFKFKVTAILPNNEERVLVDQSNNAGSLEKAYTADLGYEVKAVRVDFVGSVGGTAWPALAELDLLQEERQSMTGANIAATATITSSETKPAPEDKTALVDGKDTAWVSNNGAVPAWFNLDLPEERYVDSIRLCFEKGQKDRSMQFDLVVTNAAGEKTTVYSRSAEDLKKEQGIEINVPVGRAVKSIRMDIKDARIPSSGQKAWPLVREIEVYSTPDNAASHAAVSAAQGSTLAQDKLDALKDGNPATGATLSAKADKQLTFTFEKARDINAIGLLFQPLQQPLRFTVEGLVPGQDGGEGSWKQIADYSANKRVAGEILARLREAVLVKAVRTNILNEGDVTLNEVYLYQADGTAELSSYISGLEKKLGKLTFGEFAGNYRAEARDLLMGKVNEAKAAIEQGMNSTEAASWTAQLKAAERTFWNTAFVTIDRVPLYRTIDRAEALKAALEKNGHSDLASSLGEAIKAAKSVADRYGDVTQAQLDEATAALKSALESASSSLDARDRLQVAIDAAAKLLDGATVGDFNGQYPQAAADALTVSIDAAKKALTDHANDPAKLGEAAAALEAATETFTQSVVVIDTTAWEAGVARAQALDESGYDKDAWKQFAAVRDAVAKVDVNKISQADLDKKVAELDAAIEKLEQDVLDRTALAEVIARAQALAPEGYTAESWKQLEQALANAEKAHTATSITQAELDDAAKALADAIDGLKKEPTGQPDPEQPQPEQPDTPEQGGSGSGNGNGSGAGSNGPTSGAGTGSNGSGSNGNLAQTGDAAAIASLLGAGGFTAALAGLFRRRKQ
ncbi:alpha-N-acetylglucosaminidase TIM-barrel domain-containing protein [Collinsella sp. D33t1_170424_A12]|uniref:alpha-N-acetylglucosaminidase TIM-barrel domain-containing protein n=1 Tax=Collinsella sp. D33t1_170424_A12 TaxID=2787135 RepID=UPI001E3B605B|nr:alpha-N-acetylglucosaminidase TIM-barrel domain-containing protein [Collinsella sp. D33t1_170424_A12]